MGLIFFIFFMVLWSFWATPEEIVKSLLEDLLCCWINLGVIYSSLSWFCGHFNLLEGNFEIAILLNDFFLGSKSASSGNLGKFLAPIWGFFLANLPGRFGSNLLICFMILRTRYPFVSLFFVRKVTVLADFVMFWHILEVFFWMSCQMNLGVIYSSASCSWLIERNFWNHYPFAWLFFSVQKLTFQATLAHFCHILKFFFWINWHINLGVIYSYTVCFCGQFDLLESKFWDCYPFLWSSSWFKKWHLSQFSQISSTFWRIFSEWVDKSFYK